MKLIIDIDEDTYKARQHWVANQKKMVDKVDIAIANGTSLTPNVLADLLMEERIRGELKQDISYSKDVIDNVRCKLTVEIIDRRPCYCGAELRAVWRERKDSAE